MGNFPKFFLLFLSLFIKFLFCSCDCDLDAPIFKENKCQLIYCSQSQFESGECSINNTITKTQWLTDIIVFDQYKLRYGSFAINSKGNLIYECSVEKEALGTRLFYGLKNNGNFFFKNENGEETSTKVIIIKDGNNYPIRYESQIIFVTLSDGKECLISISLFTGMVELYDFNSDTFSQVSTIEFTDYNIYSTISTLMEFKNGNTNEYFYAFLGQHKTDQKDYKHYYLVLQKYSFTKNKINLNDGYFRQKNNFNETVGGTRIVSGYKTDSNIIVIFYLNALTYSNKYYKIEVFNENLEKLNERKLNGVNNVITYDEGGIFYKGIYIKNNIGAFIFYTSKNDYYPKFRIIEINSSSINEIYQTVLNWNNCKFIPEPLLNDAIKINDKRFSFIASSNDREKLFIILFDFYNDYNSIKTRLYKIEITKLYNYRIYREISTILYNNYLVLSSSACISSFSCDISDENFENFFSFLIFFGYVNGNDTYIDISKFLTEYNNVNNKENNLVYKLIENAKIDNNIFGYEFVENIKLISIPEELNFYNIENMKEIQLKENETLNYIYKLEQNKYKIKKNKTYYFEFQYIVQEAELEKFNQYAIEIKTLNISNNQNYKEENFTRKLFYGRTNKVKFKLCNELCNTCTYLGTSLNDQKCITCIENYDYFNDFNGNCVPENYYRDKELNEIKICEDDSKYYIEPNTSKRICFKKEYECPVNFPFYSKDDKECLAFCSYEDLLNKNCEVNNSKEKNAILYNLFKEYILKNYTGNDNLILESDDNYIFQLTNSLNEANTKSGLNENNYNLSMIDLDECEDKLKINNGIDKYTPLIIFKFEKIGTVASQKYIQYEVYNPKTKEKLDLSVCLNEKINIYIPVILTEETLQLQKDLFNYGYDLFNPNDSFYQDICSGYTSVNGTDVILSDRRKYFFNDTQTSCQENCQYSQYSAETQQLKCVCSVSQIDIEPKKEEKFDGSILFSSFYDVIKFSNILVLKCYKLVFSYEGQERNYGSMLMIGYFLFYCVFNFIYFIKGFAFVKLYSAKILFNNKDINIDDNNLNNNNGNKKLRKRSSKKSSNLSIPPRRKIKSKTRRSNNRYRLGGFSLNSDKIFNNSNDINSDSMNNDKKESMRIILDNKKSNVEINNNDFKKKSLDQNFINLNNNNPSKLKNSFFGRNIHKRKTYNNSYKINHYINNLNNNTYNNNNINNNNFDNENVHNDENKVDYASNCNNRLSLKSKNSKTQLIKISSKKGFSSYFKGDNFSDFELNELSYVKAVQLDKRNFFRYYWQLIRREHIIIFTFFAWNDYNIFTIKLSKFIFAIVLDFALNTLFFIDDSMHKIYLDYGKYIFIAQIPQIIYSSVASQSLDVVLRYLALTEKDIYRIKQLEKRKNKVLATKKIFGILKCIKIKLCGYFILTFIFICFFWYFISAFCAVYKNTQMFLIKDSLTSFSISLITPFIMYIFPAAFRIISLKDKKKRLKFLYKLSDIIPII